MISNWPTFGLRKLTLSSDKSNKIVRTLAFAKSKFQNDRPQYRENLSNFLLIKIRITIINLTPNFHQRRSSLSHRRIYIVNQKRAVSFLKGKDARKARSVYEQRQGIDWTATPSRKSLNKPDRQIVSDPNKDTRRMRQVNQDNLFPIQTQFEAVCRWLRSTSPQ